MHREMRQQARQVRDRAIICAMLDEMDTIYIGMHDEPAPYVVPVNFGYAFDEALVFYFHCAMEGYKLELLGRNPHVCVTASRFISYAEGSVRGHLHDFRSVIARGVAQRIEPGTEAFAHAHRQLLAHNRRDPGQADTPAARFIQMWRIVCRPEDVTAKAEIVPRSVQEVPFAPAVPDGSTLDERHILGAQQEAGTAEA